MAPVITRANAKSMLEPGIDNLFGLEYNNLPDQWSQIFEKRTSKRAWEEDLKVSGFGYAARKDEGGVYTYDVMNESYKTGYKHETWGLAFAITKEAIEDNLYMDVAARGAKMLATSLKKTKEVNCAAILNNAFNSSYVGGDGKEMLATDHPMDGGGTFANEPTVAVDISETALESAFIDIGDWTDDRGLKINVMPKRVIVPTALTFTINKLLSSKAVLQPGTANNTINALVTLNAFKNEPFIYNYLTDSDAWFIQTDVSGGLVFYQRTQVETGMEGSFEDDNMRYKARERYSMRWSDPRGMYGCPGA